ncbi:MAG: hypothetical protein MZU97_26520 [Bacillus subtilis]|nr:hypothetical protein [Bacillus subtilis]
MRKLTIRHPSLTLVRCRTRPNDFDFSRRREHASRGRFTDNIRFGRRASKRWRITYRFTISRLRNDAGLGKDVGQAVALSVYGDDFTATNCHFDRPTGYLVLGSVARRSDRTLSWTFLPEEELHTRPLTHALSPLLDRRRRRLHLRRARPRCSTNARSSAWLNGYRRRTVDGTNQIRSGLVFHRLSNSVGRQSDRKTVSGASVAGHTAWRCSWIVRFEGSFHPERVSIAWKKPSITA